MIPPIYPIAAAAFTLMPYVNVRITKGASREQKARIVKGITEKLIAEEDWGFSGMLTDEWKKTQG
jgi:4-oxalocrotonate tautomerase